MRRSLRFHAVAAALALLLAALPAWAGALPDSALDSEYASCMGGDAANAPRAAYCACVRDGMRNWDEATLTQVAKQAAAANPNDPNGLMQQAGPLQTLAKTCLAKTMQ